jgi:hypothetical protein
VDYSAQLLKEQARIVFGGLNTMEFSARSHAIPMGNMPRIFSLLVYTLKHYDSFIIKIF